MSSDFCFPGWADWTDYRPNHFLNYQSFVSENRVTFLWKLFLPTNCYQAFYAVVSPKHPDAMDGGVWLSPVSGVPMGYLMCSLDTWEGGNGQQSPWPTGNTNIVAWFMLFRYPKLFYTIAWVHIIILLVKCFPKKQCKLKLWVGGDQDNKIILYQDSRLTFMVTDLREV